MTTQDKLREEWLKEVADQREPFPPGSRRADVNADDLVQERSASVTGPIVVALFGVAATVVLALFALTAPNPLPAAVFGVVLLAVPGYMVYSIIRTRRFGRLTLRLNGAPSIGRELSAEFVLERCPREVKDLVVNLRCESMAWNVARTSKGRLRLVFDDKEVFAREHKCALVHTGEGARAMIRVPVPSNLPAADPLDVMVDPDSFAELGANYHFWTLRVRTVSPGADVKEDFYVPVQP